MAEGSGRPGVVVQRVVHVQGTHDLGRTPRLIDAQIGDDVRHLEAAIGTSTREHGTARSRRRTSGRVAKPAGTNQAEATLTQRAEGYPAALFDIEDLRYAALFSRDRGREAVAELRRVTEHEPARVTRIRGREDAPV